MHKKQTCKSFLFFYKQFIIEVNFHGNLFKNTFTENSNNISRGFPCREGLKQQLKKEIYRNLHNLEERSDCVLYLFNLRYQRVSFASVH